MHRSLRRPPRPSPKFRRRLPESLVATHWPDTLRVAGALVTHQIRACAQLRMFGRERHPTPLGGAAFAEYGRNDKTMHLLALADPVDDTYRRLLNGSSPSRSPTASSPARSATAAWAGPPGVPRGPRRSVGKPGPGPQHCRPVEYPLPGCRRRPAPRRGPRHQG
ncbi:Tn3 family transposase [Streptomyces sp. PDY-4]|uniref:Tn3 family transposase n=1 Tax=Streptomyces sp. PDY-4 TaxID=3376070 RepID=UPI00379B2F8C